MSNFYFLLFAFSSPKWVTKEQSRSLRLRGSEKALGRNWMLAEKTPGVTGKAANKAKDTNYHCWTLSRFTQQWGALQTGLAGRGCFPVRMCTFVPKELKRNKAAAFFFFFTLTQKVPQIIVIHNRFAESILLQNGLSQFTLENINVNSSKNVAHTDMMTL